MLAPCDHFESVASAEVGYISELGKGRRNWRSPCGHAWEERKRAFLKYHDSRQDIFFFLITIYVQTISILSGEHSNRYHSFFFFFLMRGNNPIQIFQTSKPMGNKPCLDFVIKTTEKQGHN